MVQFDSVPLGLISSLRTVVSDLVFFPIGSMKTQRKILQFVKMTVIRPVSLRHGKPNKRTESKLSCKRVQVAKTRINVTWGNVSSNNPEF